MANRPVRLRRTRRRDIVLASMLVLVLLALVPIAFLWSMIEDGRPRLDGSLAVAGLGDPVSIERDRQGTPTISASSRIDLARALGFLHGQERFFQMDLLRRDGAGELSGLVGIAAVPVDRSHRLHRFRARADAILQRMPAAQRQLIDAYVDGVNAGLKALRRKPFEYTLLGATPAPWIAADTLLTIYAMYFDLQDSNGWPIELRSLARRSLGTPLTDYLYPPGTPEDAALDGSTLAQPPMPDRYQSIQPTVPATPAPPPGPTNGSNAFAVAGSLTGTGAAIVANDMHLGLRVPDIWYRARMRVGGFSPLDLDGVTLPGTPMLVAGSNGHIAWGFTDSYARTGDLVVLDQAGGADDYAAPGGTQRLQKLTESICPLKAPCQDLVIEESIWGPVVGRDADGKRLVWRWTAHDGTAIQLDGMLGLETATDVRAALDAAHRAGMPQQNFVVGDSAGHIGWTIIGQLPKRVGLGDGPQSWADGNRGWQGYLAPGDVPEIIDPPGGRIWTANNRVVGGPALAILGDGGYVEADRAHAIRDDLNARTKFAERDLLAVQLDTRAHALDGWEKLLVKLLQAREADSSAVQLLPLVEAWGGNARIDSVGYRLVRTFEEQAVRLIYDGLAGPLAQRGELSGPLVGTQARWPSLQLLTAEPSGLVPPPYKDWHAVEDALVDNLEHAVGTDAARFTWGARNHLGIHHPLAPFVPLLGLLTDPKDRPIDGDAIVPHVSTPGFGASERMVVSPGHEADAIFEMPGGNAGSPAAPYFLAGTQDWITGAPTPFLPGLPSWTLTLVPGPAQ